MIKLGIATSALLLSLAVGSASAGTAENPGAVQF